MEDEMAIVKRFANRLPVDVVSLIEALGIDYVEEDMGRDSSGRIEIDEPACIITVNGTEGPQRRRFTAAHELGHYLLHRDLMEGQGHLDRLYMEGRGDNPYAPLSPTHEVEANKFAAALLMPAGVLKQRYDPTSDNINELADLCGVSRAAMKIRLRAIGARMRD